MTIFSKPNLSHRSKVKRMMSRVIRDHLGWLVVWGQSRARLGIIKLPIPAGNVFGGLIGIASWLANY